MKNDEAIRYQLVKLLQGGQAFKSMDAILEGITSDEAGKVLPCIPYTLWQLMEHLRIALFDILDFSRDPAYESPAWPDGYWLAEKAPADQATINQSIATIKEGLAAMEQLVQDPANDLYQPFPHGEGQNLLREAMLVAEHNAYHLGQMVIIRRILGDWK